MEYKINFDVSKNIVSITNEGRLTFQKASQYSIDAIKLAHQNNSNRYLFDHTMTDLEHGTYKLHTDGAALENFGFKSGDKVAIIIISTIEKRLLNNNATHAAKWCAIKYFNVPEEAEEWLTKDEQTNDSDQEKQEKHF